MRTKSRIAAALISVVAFAASAAVASGEVFQVGNLIFEADGSFKPTKLPKKKWAPLKQLHVEGHLSTDDGRTPPITRRVVVDFDKNGKVNTKGLPKCTTRELENTLTNQARNACKKALVGKGETNAIVDFPDQDPFEAAGPLLAFNGKPQGGKKVIIFHVFAHVPAPTTFVVPAVMSKSPEPGFGTRVTANIPTITGDNGVLTDFDVTIGKTWKHKGKKVSYLQARCSNGRFVAQAHLEFDEHLASGPPPAESLDLGVVRPCKSKG